MTIQSISPELILNFYDSEDKLGFVIPSEKELPNSGATKLLTFTKTTSEIVREIFISFLQDPPSCELDIFAKIIDVVNMCAKDSYGERVFIMDDKFLEIAAGDVTLSIIKLAVETRFSNLMSLLPSTPITNNDDDWIKYNVFFHTHKRCPLIYKSVLTGKIHMNGYIAVHEPNELFSNFQFSHYLDGEISPEQFPMIPRYGMKKLYLCGDATYTSELSASNMLNGFFKRDMKKRLYEVIDKTKWDEKDGCLVLDRETLDRGICIFMEDLTRGRYGPRENYKELTEDFSSFKMLYQKQTETPEAMLVALEIYNNFVKNGIDEFILLPAEAQTPSVRAVCLKDVYSDKVPHAIGVPEHYDAPLRVNATGSFTLAANCIYEY